MVCPPPPRGCRRPWLRSRRPQRHLHRPLRREDPPCFRGQLQEPRSLSLDPLLRRPLPISDAEKNQIKALIVSPMLKVSRRIRPQLSEALSIVSSHDFPLSWPSLLPELISNIRSAANYSIVNGLLGAAKSLLLKFRHSTDTSALCLNLKYCLDGFAAPPLPEVFVKATQFISANATASSPDVLCPFFECQRLNCRIFHSLNSTELPEFFDDPMREWMT